MCIARYVVLSYIVHKDTVCHGVAYCASCDGMFYKDKIVVVVGGGNSAVSDAALLSRIAKKVIIVYRRDTLRATKIYHDQLMKTENIEFRWNNTVNELIYGERLTGVRLKDTVTGEENIIECDGLFVSIGRKPTTDFLDNQIDLDALTEITETSESNTVDRVSTLLQSDPYTFLPYVLP